MNESPIDIGPEFHNLHKRLLHDEEVLDVNRKSSLNTLIYYFEKFLDQHRKYEETLSDLIKLEEKIEQLQGEYDEDF